MYSSRGLVGKKIRMEKPYLLRTQPAFRNYLWGGRNLHTVLGKKLPDDGIWAESWEIVDHPEHQSLISNGSLAGRTVTEVVASAPHWLLGRSPTTALPLLLKYLDCQRVLSVQVHPNDQYAQKMVPPDLGKTEAWYVISAQAGAVLYAGLKAGVSRYALAEAIANGVIEDCLHVIEPKAGDCVFIPAGTVHALGAGLLVAEIQQSSNTTFRLYDWNRVDDKGKSRELHIAQSLEVIDFERGPISLQVPQATSDSSRHRLVQCDKFTLDRIDRSTQQVLGDSRFHYLTAPYGGVLIEHDGETVELASGESVLAPACMPKASVTIQPGGVLLDMYIA